MKNFLKRNIGHLQEEASLSQKFGEKMKSYILLIRRKTSKLMLI